MGTAVQRCLCTTCSYRAFAGLASGFGHGRKLIAGSAERAALGPRAVRIFTNQFGGLMDILYLLIPLSVILVFFILGGLWWAIDRGQFEDIEGEGERILKDT